MPGAIFGLLLLWAGPSLAARVQLAFRYRAMPAKISVYGLKPGANADVWDMGVSSSVADLPIGAVIPNGTIQLKGGQHKTMVLVLHNDGAAPLDFFAAPHHVEPPEGALGLQFWCLCNGNAYHVPAHSYWYRVVRVGLGEQFKGSSLTLTHLLMATKAPPGD